MPTPRQDRGGIVLAVMLTLGLLLAGCGGEEAEEPDQTPEAATDVTETETAAAAGQVNVLLSEYIVEPDPTSAPAGEITFLADNQGGTEHELVVARAEAADTLPTDEDGAVDEDQIAEEDLLGEVEELERGATGELTVDLEPGTYVLFCNIVEEEDDETVSHFAEGMHNTFTVE